MNKNRHAVSRHAMAGADWPVLVSIPHAGRDCPEWITEKARVPPDLLGRLSDGWCDLIGAPLLARGATVVKANLLRAVADCNRHEADMDPVDVAADLRARFGPPGRKARAGLGVVPARLPGPGPLWSRPLNEEDYEARLELLHRPYHRTLANQVERLLQQHEQLLLIDLHSMPPLPPSRSDPHPAQIIVGDRFGRSATPAIARGLAIGSAPSNVRIAINAPYAGGHIVETHGRPNGGVHAVQIEFDRRLYLDSDGLANADNALMLGQWLVDSADRILNELAHIVPLAAE